MANQSDSPFKGAGVFTTRTPSSANNVPAAWVALEAKSTGDGQLEGGDSAVQMINSQHASGRKAFIWAGSTLQAGVTTADQDRWNANALAAAQRYGADGVIFSGETPLEMEAAQRAAAGSNMPTAIVGNPSLVGPGQWNPKVTAMPEAYLNANEYQSPVNMVATSQRAGAVDIVPIYGYYNDGGVHAVVPFSTYDAQAQKAGIGNFGVFNAETLISNSNDAQAFSTAAARPVPSGPLPQLGGPRPPTPVFSGLTTFTAGSPTFGLPLAGSVDGMAVKASGADATPDAIGTFNNAGVRTYAWAQPISGDYQGQLASNNQAAAAAVQQGAKGLILPGMDDAQLQAAQAVAATSQIPVAIITNPANLAKVPATTTAMLLGDGLGPDQLAQQAASRPNTVPVVAAYDNESGGTMVNRDGLLGQYLAKSGPNVGIFTLDSARYSQPGLAALGDYTFSKATGGVVPTAATTASAPAAAAAASTGAAAAGGQSAAPQKPLPVKRPGIAAKAPAPPQPLANNPALPAWRQDVRWQAPTPEQQAAGVLERRPGAGDNTVLRMSDGTYKVAHADGSITGGGNWNAQQWQPFVAGSTNWQQPTPAKSSAGGQNNPKSVLENAQGVAPAAATNSGSINPDQSAAAIAQQAAAHPAQVEYVQIGPGGPTAPPVPMSTPPPAEANPIAAFSPSVAGGLSEN